MSGLMTALASMVRDQRIMDDDALRAIESRNQRDRSRTLTQGLLQAGDLSPAGLERFGREHNLSMEELVGAVGLAKSFMDFKRDQAGAYQHLFNGMIFNPTTGDIRGTAQFAPKGFGATAWGTYDQETGQPQFQRPEKQEKTTFGRLIEEAAGHPEGSKRRGQYETKIQNEANHPGDESAANGLMKQSAMFNENRQYYNFMRAAMIDPDTGAVRGGKEEDYARLEQRFAADVNKIAGGGRPSWWGQIELDKGTAKQILGMAGGDPARARQIAKEMGYRF